MQLYEIKNPALRFLCNTAFIIGILSLAVVCLTALASWKAAKLGIRAMAQTEPWQQFKGSCQIGFNNAFSPEDQYISNEPDIRDVSSGGTDTSVNNSQPRPDLAPTNLNVPQTSISDPVCQSQCVSCGIANQQASNPAQISHSAAILSESSTQQISAGR